MKISIVFTIIGTAVLALSIRYGWAVGIIIGGAALAGGWWAVEKNVDTSRND